jgi:hypothetical protein
LRITRKERERRGRRRRKEVGGFVKNGRFDGEKLFSDQHKLLLKTF